MTGRARVTGGTHGDGSPARVPSSTVAAARDARTARLAVPAALALLALLDGCSASQPPPRDAPPAAAAAPGVPPVPADALPPAGEALPSSLPSGVTVTRLAVPPEAPRFVPGPAGTGGPPGGSAQAVPLPHLANEADNARASTAVKALSTRTVVGVDGSVVAPDVVSNDILSAWQSAASAAAVSGSPALGPTDHVNVAHGIARAVADVLLLQQGLADGLSPSAQALQSDIDDQVQQAQQDPQFAQDSHGMSPHDLYNSSQARELLTRRLVRAAERARIAATAHAAPDGAAAAVDAWLVAHLGDHRVRVDGYPRVTVADLPAALRTLT